MFFLLAFVSVANAAGGYGTYCNATVPCNSGLRCGNNTMNNICTTDYGKYGYPCTTSATCDFAYTCSSVNNTCWTPWGQYGAPCTVSTCSPTASSSTCLASAECALSSTTGLGSFYCQAVGTSGQTVTLCVNANSYQAKSPPASGGFQGFPCIYNGSSSPGPTCLNGVGQTNYCQNDATTLATYGQPTCVFQNIPGNANWCSTINDCKGYVSQYTYPGPTTGIRVNYPCCSSTNLNCNRTSCDSVQLQCQKWSDGQVWFNPSCNACSNCTCGN